MGPRHMARAVIESLRQPTLGSVTSVTSIITCGIGAEKVMTRPLFPTALRSRKIDEERGVEVEKLAPTHARIRFPRFDFRFKK